MSFSWLTSPSVTCVDLQVSPSSIQMCKHNIIPFVVGTCLLRLAIRVWQFCSEFPALSGRIYYQLPQKKTPTNSLPSDEAASEASWWECQSLMTSHANLTVVVSGSRLESDGFYSCPELVTIVVLLNHKQHYNSPTWILFASFWRISRSPKHPQDCPKNLPSWFNTDRLFLGPCFRAPKTRRETLITSGRAAPIRNGMGPDGKELPLWVYIFVGSSK